jgi:hypothetical protein
VSELAANVTPAGSTMVPCCNAVPGPAVGVPDPLVTTGETDVPLPPEQPARPIAAPSTTATIRRAYGALEPAHTPPRQKDRPTRLRTAYLDVEQAFTAQL